MLLPLVSSDRSHVPPLTHLLVAMHSGRIDPQLLRAGQPSAAGCLLSTTLSEASTVYEPSGATGHGAECPHPHRGDVQVSTRTLLNAFQEQAREQRICFTLETSIGNSHPQAQRLKAVGFVVGFKAFFALFLTYSKSQETFSCCFKAQSRHRGPMQKTTQQDSPKFHCSASAQPHR